MTSSFDQWLAGMLLLTAALALLAAVYGVWHWVNGRRSRRSRVAAARVRAGHLPGNVPSQRGGLSGQTAFGALDSDTGHAPLAEAAGALAVDEQPRIRIRYFDVMAKKVDAVLQVQHLDTQKRVVTGYLDLPANVRRIPLRDIQSARLADTNQRFNIDTWVDAVRVARRRQARPL